MISKETFELSFTKMAAPLPPRMNLNQAYEAGVRFGGPVGGLASGAINLMARRPGATALTALGIGGALFLASKLRNVFTIVNETNKRNIMNRQADIMKTVAYNTGYRPEPVSQQPIPYPMR